jgi:hypothetical protein
VLLGELLASHDPVAVEAAIARLAIIGHPALRQVLQELGKGDPAHQPRLLRVLERIGDPSALSSIRALLGADLADVAMAAVDAMSTLLDARDAAVATAALDALTATLLDASRDDAVRLRAFEAICNAPDPSAAYDADVIEPLRAQLRREASTALRTAIGPAAATAPDGAQARPGDSGLDALRERDLAADPAQLREWLAVHGATAPLTVLHRLIERVRAHEATLNGEPADLWRVLRAALHLALAARGSRLAVYDLRETLAALGDQTPVGMLSALQLVGDPPVLEVVADVWQGTTDPWFRGQLVTIFRAVAAREKITRRHAAARKLATRLPEAAAAMWG